MDRGTDDRAVKIALVKSNLAREDLPEDLSEIVFPVSAMFTCFYFKSSPFTLRTNGASIFPARLLAPRCGASLRDCVDRIAGWMRLGLTRYILKMQCKTLNIFFQEAPSGISFDCSSISEKGNTGRLESTEEPLESNLESTNCDSEVEGRDLRLHLEESTILSQGVQMISYNVAV